MIDFRFRAAVGSTFGAIFGEKRHLHRIVPREHVQTVVEGC